MDKDLYIYFDVDDTSNCSEHEHGNQRLRTYIGKNPPIGSRFVPKNWGILYTTEKEHTGCLKCGYRISYYNVKVIDPKIRNVKKTYNELLQYDLYYFTGLHTSYL